MAKALTFEKLKSIPLQKSQVFLFFLSGAAHCVQKCDSMVLICKKQSSQISCSLCFNSVSHRGQKGGKTRCKNDSFIKEISLRKFFKSFCFILIANHPFIISGYQELSWYLPVLDLGIISSFGFANWSCAPVYIFFNIHID